MDFEFEISRVDFTSVVTYDILVKLSRIVDSFCNFYEHATELAILSESTMDIRKIGKTIHTRKKKKKTEGRISL